MNIYWTVLLVAVAVEIAWALSLKWIQLHPGALSIGSAAVLTILNVFLLSFAMRGIPVGTAYAIWTGLGAVGIAIFGVLLFQEPVALSRFAFMGLIILGVTGLKLTSVQ
ncbi:quaternary ammonium compound-resistance protein SugE [gamma proteobacterium HTCC5015]|nr:quaternary ammonium compound-resistance protein SugE [gamma proteobacterium HTCC5015]